MSKQKEVRGRKPGPPPQPPRRDHPPEIMPCRKPVSPPKPPKK